MHVQSQDKQARKGQAFSSSKVLPVGSDGACQEDDERNQGPKIHIKQRPIVRVLRKKHQDTANDKADDPGECVQGNERVVDRSVTHPRAPAS
jgi:hypothetical protein